MTITNLVNPLLKNEDISIYMKESYINAAKTPYVRQLFERAPEKDVINITKKYNQIPDLYDDLFNGKIKIFLHGISNNADPIFNENAVKPENYKEKLGPKSLIGYVIKIFDALDRNQKTVNRISLQNKDDRLRLMTFDFDHKAIDQFDLEILDKNNPFVKILDYAQDKHVELYRD